MKIGLSYSRCVRDLVKDNVDIDDVLVIISRTDFDPRNDQHWNSIWQGYGGGGRMGSMFSMPEWADHPAEDEDRFRSVSIELWETGRLHQPRQFGVHPVRSSSYYWLETIPMLSQLESSPAVKSAWEQFQIVAGLTGSNMFKHKQGKL